MLWLILKKKYNKKLINKLCNHFVLNEMFFLSILGVFSSGAFNNGSSSRFSEIKNVLLECRKHNVLNKKCSSLRGKPGLDMKKIKICVKDGKIIMIIILM